MVDTVYTIGYAGFAPEDFLAALKKRGIAVVVDVRSTPYSGRFPAYNKEALEHMLRSAGLYYRSYAGPFGARQEDPRYYCQAGYLDFERFARSDAFREGVDKLRRSMDQDYSFALMCAEKDPMQCHRAILVSRAFSRLGYRVAHLLPDSGAATQQDVERRLLDKFFPDRAQMTLFDAAPDEADLVDEAYRRQNAEIGFRLEDL